MSAAKGKEIVEEHQQGDDTAISNPDPEFLEKLPCRLLDVSEPLARPWITIADDCVPTFPPVPPISGINRAKAGSTTNPPSKRPRITELQIPPTIPIRSHGRRALGLGKQFVVALHVARKT